ncbi:MAG: type IX secretion system membrane protein PorP/SprF [Bacteroidia bacterium]|nr:type IX secretion system membrane protein PorP/SprF [Bacteroidia bacterium]MCZ2247638.1 type IX secretion system membrane protein PorP/SprF [Bacteroidia bacterium]
MKNSFTIEKKFFGLFTSLLLLLSVEVTAQQAPRYSMYMFNTMNYNPAYAGYSDEVVSTLLYRKQWLNFPGAPQTGSFNIHTPIRQDNMGVGLSFINDKAGAVMQNSLNMAYSYHLKFKTSRLAFGLQAVVQNYSVALSKVKTNPLGEADNAFNTGDINAYSLNFGTGAYYFSNNYYVGLSAPFLLNNKIGTKIPGSNSVAKQGTHAYLTGGYVFSINPIVKLKPSALLKYAAHSPLQADINLMGYFYDIIGFGTTYRTSDSFNAMAEIILPKGFRLAYAYDYTISPVKSFQAGSHEIILQYRFGFSKDKLSSPRFF